MKLAVGAFAGVVLVLIVRIKLKMVEDRKQAAQVNFGSAPFLILALVVHLNAGVR